jgi:hypothetical protein
MLLLRIYKINSNNFIYSNEVIITIGYIRIVSELMIENLFCSET